MVTIKKFRENQETRGKLFICRSPRFGIALLLGINYPSRHFEQKNTFVNVQGGSVYYFSSVENDEILHTWSNVSYMDNALKMLEKLRGEKLSFN